MSALEAHSASHQRSKQKKVKVYNCAHTTESYSLPSPVSGYKAKKRKGKKRGENERHHTVIWTEEVR